MSEQIKDGGSAFPQSDLSGYGMGPGTIDGGERYDVSGMTLRDYFAAHAPTKVASWFAPTGISFSDRFDDRPPLPHGRTERNPRGTSAAVGHCAECDAYYKACEVFEEDRERRRSEYEMAKCVQWPWAYADAMLAERERAK